MNIVKRPEKVTHNEIMEVYEEDVQVMKTYTIAESKEYLKNIEMSLQHLKNDTVPDTLSEDMSREEELEYLRKPFSLKSSHDPGGAYYEFSMVPYTAENRTDFYIEKFTTSEGRLIISDCSVGKYLKADYDGFGIYDCLKTFQSILQNQILDQELNSIPEKKDKAGALLEQITNSSSRESVERKPVRNKI